VNAEELTGAELTMEVTRRAYMLAAEREIDSLRTQLAEAQKNADAFEMEWDKALIGRAEAEARETALREAEIKSAEGVIAWRVSGRDSPCHGDCDRCACCEGPHVFGRGIDGIEGSWGGWVFDAIRGIPEGAHVRVVIARALSGEQEAGQ
jgi:hypothetical protein